MRAGAMSIIADRVESGIGLTPSSPASRNALPAAVPNGSPRIPTQISTRGFSSASFSASPQIKGWARKALEFIDSGPPALLNNPCCCRRVVLFFPQTSNGGSLWLKKRKPRSRRL